MTPGDDGWYCEECGLFASIKITDVNGDWPWKECRAQVGAGWWPLLDRLRDDLFVLGWDGYVAQIKEKFGGLRFYIGTGNAGVFNRIAEAEIESETLCEACGKPGVQRTRRPGGWVVARCDACFQAEG